MTKVKAVSVVVLIGAIAMSSGVAGAQTRARDACIGCEVTFDLSATADGPRLRAIGGGGVVVDKQMRSNGLFISISSPGDQIELVAEATGRVTIRRRGNVVAVNPADVLADYQSKVAALTMDSAAVQGLERMVVALRHSARPEALSVLASFALLRSLHGDDTGNALLAQQGRNAGARIRPVAAQQTRAGDVVTDCWAEYERTLSRNFDRYSTCLREYWWNQPVQYACGLEFAMVGELALFRVISCSGGFPLP